ncbi:Small auxin-up RNA protein [Dioscorea alata]|uniref:Small auxin-up RNA protein n=1 Tax=Dioscorea alata TaxID=55571 RepID=A0ACB7VZ47_DIOAL|nr:Small auxin-up RNA protein [Dioscorea alata]
MGIRASKLCRVLMGRKMSRDEDGVPVAARKGYIPVSVGLGKDCKRFMIHMSCFGDEDLLELLCRSAEEYGFHNQGILRIPCDAKNFEDRMFIKDVLNRKGNFFFSCLLFS